MTSIERLKQLDWYMNLLEDIDMEDFTLDEQIQILDDYKNCWNQKIEIKKQLKW